MADKLQLTPEQEKIVRATGHGLAVMAGAGSGKTTTLVQKCRKLIEDDASARLVAVSFTERSASDFREKLTSHLGKSPDQFGHWVMTIHGLCSSVIREFPRQAGFDGEEKVLSPAETQVLWEQALEALWFGDLPELISKALDRLLDRESRASLLALLRRVRELEGFGVLASLQASSDLDAQALAHLSEFSLERYERLKRRRGGLDFGDLERGADRALSDSAVRANYHARFKLVLVDEFQDTNPVQARLLWKIARPDLSNLCVVGDPKQSIYRFRDADVSVFEEFCALLPERASLTWNFRSRPGILEFANDICAPAFENSGMVYEALVPKREVATETSYAPVERLSIDEPGGLAKWLVEQVQSGIALDEMALLVRKIRGNERWFKALSAAGIPLAMGSGGLFWEDPRVRELVAFLRWWDQPGNSLAGAVFLRSPWVGVTDAELDVWVREDRTWMKPFLESTHPLAQVLRPLRDRTVRPGELLMELLISPEIEAEIGAPLLGLWHRAEELSSRGSEFHGVVSELAMAVEDGRRERDVPPPRGQGQLLVLTLHGSKGLEFTHVILIDFPVTTSRVPPYPLLYWDRVRGAYLGPRTEEGERNDEVPDEQLWRADEKAKSLAESKRLFYVALTRARERLVLATINGETKVPAKEAAENSSPFGRDHWRAWVESVRIPVVKPNSSEFNPTSLPPPPQEDWKLLRLSPVPEVRTRFSVTEWNTLGRCPRRYEWSRVRPRELKSKVPEILETNVPRVDGVSRRELGTRVHAFLESGDFEGLRALEVEAGVQLFQAEPLIAWAKSCDWMRSSESASGRQVWTELDFEVAIGKEVLVGSMDRVVLEVKGGEPRATLIDFKVTSKSKATVELIQNYQIQMSLYVAALVRLAPELKNRVEAVLVEISPQGVRNVPLAVMADEELESLGALAARIVAGEEGAPIRGDQCRFCEFRTPCLGEN